jgi:ABC-2 type transport system ATP-binding protein
VSDDTVTDASDTRPPVLELRGVGKTFRDFWMRPRVKAVRDVDLTVRRGEVLGLLGPNGSGKTTTIKMILGLLQPTAGRIAVLGKPPTDVGLKHRLGYLPEESNLYRFLNAEETLDFYGRIFRLPGERRKQRVDALLEMVGLEAARYRPVGEYSKGMQRRVGLAQALINDPDLLILDEPTTGMDPIATRQIKDLIRTLRDRGKTVLLCTHLLGEVEDVCDRLVIMYGGRIRATGTVDELLRVDGRQSIDVTGGPMDEATVGRLRTALAGEGREVENVHVPKRRLEELFLDVVDQATRGGEATTGAAVGAGVAGFLSEEARGEDLLASLAKVESEPPAKPVDEQPVEPVEPDAAALGELSSSSPTMMDPVEPAPPRPPVEADDAVLSELTGGDRRADDEKS